MTHLPALSLASALCCDGRGMVQRADGSIDTCRACARAAEARWRAEQQVQAVQEASEAAPAGVSESSQGRQA